jgi:hypothetical protein
MAVQRHPSLVLAFVFFAGCGSGRSTLVVDVVTELCPDVTGGPRCLERRFDTVIVSLDDAMVVARPALSSDRYLEGQRVAEYVELPSGTYRLELALQLDGVTVARAARSVDVVDAVQTLQIVIGSECAGVLCPSAGGDDDATECLDGECVDPACFDPEGSHDECGALCESDADCPASVPCASTECRGGVCIETLDDSACPFGQRCIAETGCYTGALEGDPCETADDCGDTDLICCGNACRQPDCNDGNACTEDACTRDGCVNMPADGACDDGVFCNGADSCQAGACSGHAGVPCSGATLICDEAMRTCLGCSLDSDCPGPSEAPLGGCGGFVTQCSEAGTQPWRVTTYRCVSNACAAQVQDESRACTLSRGGTPCGTGDSSCSGGICSCGGVECGAGQYCLGGGCWNLPTFELIGQPSPTCIDGALGPQAGALLGYRVRGRPGAQMHKYNLHSSCPGAAWGEAPETASSPIYLDGSGLYELLLDSPTAFACDFAQHGTYVQYAVVDGYATAQHTATMYNSGCSGTLANCTSATGFCL